MKIIYKFEAIANSLGLKVFEIGRAAARSSDLLQHARPTMKWIAQELNESVQLATLDGTEVRLFKQAPTAPRYQT